MRIFVGGISGRVPCVCGVVGDPTERFEAVVFWRSVESVAGLGLEHATKVSQLSSACS